MSKEILDAVTVLEREKGISADRLMAALEDALLSAYKKTPGAAKYARVEVDHGTGEFRVCELLVPADLDAQQLRERVEALLPRSEQVHGERYEHGARVKAVITDVSAQAKGPSIIVSRRNP